MRLRPRQSTKPRPRPSTKKPHDRIRTEVSADLLALLTRIPPDGPYGKLTIYRYTGSLFGFTSSLAPDHHFVVKVRSHKEKPPYFPHESEE